MKHKHTDAHNTLQTMFTFKTDNLTAKLTKLSLAVAFLLGLIVGMAQVMLDYLEQDDQLNSDINNILKAAEKPAKEAAYNLNKNVAAIIIDGLMQYSFIDNAVITNSFDEVLASGIEMSDMDGFTRSISNFLFDIDKEYTIDLPGDDRDPLYGQLSITVDKHKAMDDLYERSLFILIAGLLRNLILGAMLAAVFYIVLTRPIVKVAEEIRRKNSTKKEKPGFDIPAELADNEIGALLTTFNKFVLGVKDADNFLRTVLDSSPTAMIISNISDGVILYANPVAQTMLGRTDAELVGSMIKDFYVNMDDQELLFEISEKNVEIKDREPIKKQELLAKHKDGTKIYVDSNIQSIEYEGNKVLISTFFDLTERNQAEKALKESERQLAKSNQILSTVLEHTHMSVALLEPQFNFVLVNRAYADAGNQAPSFFPGKNHFDLYPHDENQAIFQRVVDTGEPYFVIDKEFEYPDQPERGVTYWDWSLSPVKDDTEEVTGLVLSLVEVTERKSLESQLRQAHKMEAIGTLAGGVAHQFNNALSLISGNIDFLELDYPEDEKIAGYTKQMKESAHRMAQLSRQLLAYAEGGQYQAKIISVNKFVGNTLSNIHHVINPNIEMITDLAPGILNVKADQAQMQMLLAAILTNASEAIEGEGFIRVTTKDEEVDTAFAKHSPKLKAGPYARIIVEDNGKGMDNETSNRIFEPFFSTNFVGRGLGMASAFGIVRNHDGWISVYSEVGLGTTVNVYLPLMETQAEAPLKSNMEPIEGTGTILLIEDEEMIMEVNQALLERLGYKTIGALTGKEAINIAKTFDGEIDLAILDMILPDMDAKTIYSSIME
ncbi:MAG: PAS domain S-box protein, partial [Desulfobulbaceae bacterium]|nr:PAS domain S-box protein [Desulfobulbaceae bacterium]